MTPPEDRAPEPEPEPERTVSTFHEFATEWYAGQLAEGGWSGSTARDIREWRLARHILPILAGYRLDEIGVEVIDNYRRAKVHEGLLSASSINKMLTTIAAILEQAQEYGHIHANPAKGRRRRLKAGKPRRTYLDRAEQVSALLDAAGELDRRGRVRPYRRALLTTLVFSGLRIGEARDLEWRDVDIAKTRLKVRGTKTDAADRTVRLLPALRDELAALKAARSPEPRDRVFGTSTGGALSESNVRSRTLRPAVEAANAALLAAEIVPIPDGLTPHSLRRTFASILVALKEDPASVMRQMGHTTAAFTLGVYAAAMETTDEERNALRALVEGSYDAPPWGDLGKWAGQPADRPSEPVEQPEAA